MTKNLCCFNLLLALNQLFVTGAEGVEAEGGEDVPSGGGAVVLVTGEAVVVVRECFAAELGYPIIGLFLLAEGGIEEG